MYRNLWFLTEKHFYKNYKNKYFYHECFTELTKILLTFFFFKFTWKDV